MSEMKRQLVQTILLVNFAIENKIEEKAEMLGMCVYVLMFSICSEKSQFNGRD